MTEYIVKCRELVGITGNTFQFPEYIDLTEEIVRCRDCRHYNEYHGKCHRQSGVLIDGNSTRRLEDLDDVLALADAEPDGFCKWAERRSQ